MTCLSLWKIAHLDLEALNINTNKDYVTLSDKITGDEDGLEWV